MKKLFTFFIVSFMFVTLSFSQTTIFADDFEGFTVGDWVSSSPDWDTWSGTTGGADDAEISDDYNHTAAGANSLKIIANDDIVYYFGDKTTGEYQVKFWYYLPAGQGGYFNIQHDFGAIWAFSVEFHDGGTGFLHVNDANHNFVYTQDEWVEVVMDIDLGADNIVLTIEGTEVHNWAFSQEESGGAPDITLDCVNFYGYPAVTPPYYVDDFEFIEVAAGVEHPELELSAAEFNVDGLTNQTLTLTNTGEELMTFDALVYYPQPAKKNNTQISNNSNNTTTKIIKLNSMSNEQLDTPIKVNLNPKDEVITHLTGDIGGSLGWGGTNNVDARAAALFKYDNNVTAGVDIKDYIGMEISNVIIFVNDIPVSGSTDIEIYEGRDGIENGPMNAPITTESFTVSTAGSQVPVDITSPVYVSGKDLFIGWTLTQLPGEHCVSMQEAPPTDDANWTKTGVAWSEITNPTFGNFGIVATLTGTIIHQWLALDVTTGTVAANGGTQDIELQFDLTGMSEGTYSSTVIIKTNDDDDDESYNEIPVTLDVGAGVNGLENSGIMTFPNPVTDIFTIVSETEINNVKITDLTGRLIQEIAPHSKSYKFDLSKLSKGVYIFNINTANHSVSRKIIVE